MAITDLPGLTYTRTGAATAWRKDGTLAVFAPNVPRITDAGVTIEGQRTNLLVNSAWAGGANVTSWRNDFAPSATEAASTVLEDGKARHFSATGNREYLTATGSSITMTPGATYCLSVVVEAISSGLPARTILHHGYVPSDVVRSFPACSANPSGGAEGIVQPGRLYVLLTSPGGGTTTQIRVGIGADGVGTFTGTARLSLPQLELGTRASTPIITTGAAATRGADNLYLGGLAAALGGDWSVVVSLPYLIERPEEHVFSISAGAGTLNMISVNRPTPTTLFAGTRSGGANVGSTSSVAVGGNLPVKVAARWKGGKLRFAVNGTLSTEVTPSVAPVGALDRLAVGSGQYSSGILNGVVQSTTLFPYALTDAELVELTQ